MLVNINVFIGFNTTTVSICINTSVHHCNENKSNATSASINVSMANETPVSDCYVNKPNPKSVSELMSVHQIQCECITVTSTTQLQRH